MRIDLLESDNPFSSTQCFLQGLAEGLKKAGASIRRLSCREEQLHETVRTLIQDPSEWVFSFCYLTLSGKEKGWLPAYFPHSRFFFYWIDGPLFGLPALETPNGFLSVVDRGDWKALFPRAENRLFFLPHAVSLRPISAEPRRYPLLMIASFLDPQRDQKWPQEYRLQMQRAVDAVLYEGKSLLEAFESFQLPLDPELYWEAEYLLKARERIELLQLLAPLPVHLFGPWEWKRVLGELPHVHFHGPTDYVESLQLMDQAQVVLNSSAQFRSGSHERVFGALASGAYALTSYNPYLQEEFKEKGVYFFDLQDKQSTQETVKRLLAEKKLEEQLERGKEQLQRAHSWDKRAEQLMTIMRNACQFHQ